MKSTHQNLFETKEITKILKWFLQKMLKDKKKQKKVKLAKNAAHLDYINIMQR